MVEITLKYSKQLNLALRTEYFGQLLPSYSTQQRIAKRKESLMVQETQAGTQYVKTTVDSLYLNYEKLLWKNGLFQKKLHHRYY